MLPRLAKALTLILQNSLQAVIVVLFSIRGAVEGRRGPVLLAIGVAARVTRQRVGVVWRDDGFYAVVVQEGEGRVEGVEDGLNGRVQSQ